MKATRVSRTDASRTTCQSCRARFARYTRGDRRDRRRYRGSYTAVGVFTDVRSRDGCGLAEVAEGVERSADRDPSARPAICSSNYLRERPNHDGPSARAGPGDDDVMNGAFRAMGSTVTWWAETDAGQRLATWFEQVEATCSRFRSNSELSAINASPQETINISPLMERVLRAADDAFVVSKGNVDATLLDALEAAGYDRSFDDASLQAKAPPPMVTSWCDVIVGNRRVTRSPGSRIDLGGIAKGWAAWSALDLIEGDAVVDAAGDIAMRGAWTIDVVHDGTKVASIVAADCGIATSGVDRRRWTGGHHIIDPMTGSPAVTDVMAATVVAENTPLAETVARSIVVRGSHPGLEWAATVPGVKWAAATTSAGSTIALEPTEVPV